MATINIKPDISLGVKPPATMSIADLVNTARGAQLYQREREILPEQVEQARIATQSARTAEQQAQFSLSKDQTAGLMGLVGGYRNDPRIASGNSEQAIEAMSEIRNKAIALGIPEPRVESLMSMGNAIAVNNPRRLPQYFDNVIQAQAGPASQLSLQTPVLTESAGSPALFRPATGTLQPAQIPGAEPQGAIQPEAPRGVTPADMTAPIQPAPAAPMATPTQAVDPGFPVRFPVRRAGDIRPFARGEEAAQANGEATRTLLLKTQADVPRANRSVGEIIRIADELEKDIRFTVGKPADIERAFRVNVGGETRYQELAKDIAQVQMAVNQATGARTDQQAAQVAEGTGNATYDPKVLIKIARRLRGELAEIDARATGAQKFAQKFGDSNLPEFLQQWTANSDLRIFESMAILRDIRDPKAQKEALDKILPKTEDELMEFQEKYRNIKKLTETGTLR